MLISMNDDDVLSRIAGARANLSASQLTVHDLQAGGNNEDQSRFRSDISSARLEQQNAAANLAQLKTLAQRGSASQAEVQGAQAAHGQRRPGPAHGDGPHRKPPLLPWRYRQRPKARLADSQGRARGRAGAQYNSLNIRTPISGTVYSIPFSQYDFVPSAGRRICWPSRT